MIRLEFTSERIKSSSQKDNPSRRILRLKAAGWHFLQKRKKIENLRLCLTDYVKKMSALLSFYGGHLTLDKRQFRSFFHFLFQTIDDYGDPERRQREIQENIRKHCQRYGQNSTFPDLRNFYVVDSPPLLYCLMPKSASRQWRGLLSRIGPRKRLSMSQLHAKDIEQYFSNSFKFTFVREPFERLLSSYKDKFVARRAFDRPLLKYYGAKILLRFRPNVTNKSLESLDDITFPEFVEYIIKDGVNEGFDRHWNHYIDQCNPCLIKYDFVGRYEYLAEDGNYMLGKAGEDRIRFPKEKPFDTREELLSYYSQIPLDWILDLGRIYRSNFEMFGYSFPGSLQPLFQNAVLPSHRDFP